MQKLLLIACFTLLSFNIFSQKITGVITNTDNKPIPFATIYINELQTGTCANQQGKYFIQATPDTYTISLGRWDIRHKRKK
jgi:hypothetical protein